MKKYQIPSLEKTPLYTEDIIAASGVNNIVSADDSQGADEIQESTWNDAWN